MLALCSGKTRRNIQTPFHSTCFKRRDSGIEGTTARLRGCGRSSQSATPRSPPSRKLFTMLIWRMRSLGRTEGTGLDRVLIDWAQPGISDDELLRRGMELIEGLYQSLN